MLRFISLIALVVVSLSVIGVFIAMPHGASATHGGPHGEAQPGAGPGQPGAGRGQPGVGSGQPGTPPAPATYLSSLYLWFLGFVGIAALLALVIGGVMYMFAGASLTKTEEAKKWVTNAIWGIILAAFSFLLLNTINPDLVRGFDIQTVIEGVLKRQPNAPGTTQPSQPAPTEPAQPKPPPGEGPGEFF